MWPEGPSFLEFSEYRRIYEDAKKAKSKDPGNLDELDQDGDNGKYFKHDLAKRIRTDIQKDSTSWL